MEPFNPGSRMQIAQRLIEKYDWKPKKNEYNSQGPIVNDDVLKALSGKYPEAATLAEYFRLNKIIGYVAEGRNAWLKLVKEDGRLHGRVNGLGTVTGRCSHSSPNMGQIPSCRKPWGRECRELFYAPEGYKVLGCDAKGIQLRVLAHYLHPYDGGTYAEKCLTGDQHDYTWTLSKVDTRDMAKTLMYGVLFGATPKKVGSMCGKGAAWGEETTNLLLEGLKGLRQLKVGVQMEAKSGFIEALDGRQLPIRSPHSALNTLLQGGEAIIMKRATILLDELCEAAGLVWGVDYWNAAHVHDEYQIIVKTFLAEKLGQMAAQAITDAGNYYGIMCRMDGNSIIASDWAGSH